MNNTHSRLHFKSNIRITEKTYKKLSKPFTLLFLVCLLKNYFLVIVLVPVALKATKSSWYLLYYLTYLEENNRTRILQSSLVLIRVYS